MSRHPQVDQYIADRANFERELSLLRELLTATELVEVLKWDSPCYSLDGVNVIGLRGFKSYVGLWFFQGALLDDPHQLLVSAAEGRTRAQRQMRFQSYDDIQPRIVKSYVRAAIELARHGRTIKPDRDRPIDIPALLRQAFADDAALESAFAKLTRGKQREFAEFIAEAKRAQTQLARLEKIRPLILAGSGLHDRWKSG